MTSGPIRRLASHAADRRAHSKMMPVNERYPLARAPRLPAWYQAGAGAMFVEYVMLAGSTTRSTGDALAGVLDPTIFKVNLIPTTPPEALQRGSKL